MNRTLAPLAAALILVASSALGQSSPTTITPDRATVLVSKDINGERWAITRDLSNGSVTGNVFVPGSPDPQFVYCTQTGQGAGGIVFNCFGTGRCGVPDCAANWLLLGPVTLPASFFAAGTGPVPTPVPTAAPTPVPASCPQNGPLTDLRVNCSRYAYFYRTGSVVAGLSSSGSLAVVCMASPTTDVICARGPVSNATTASLTQGSVDDGPYVPIGAGSRLTLMGSRIEVVLNILGDRFTFTFTWFDTDTTSSLSVESYLGRRSGIDRALRAGAGQTLEEAVRLLAADAGG